jgi:hypothetical protein
MLPRWITDLNDINLFLQALEKVLQGFDIEKNKRGRPPKHDRKDYLKLIIVKEWKKRSLRAAETDYSELVCGERVDHSVIHYEEKVLRKFVEEVIVLVGKKLDSSIGYEFSVMDSTKFSTWKKGTVEYHMLIRVAGRTVYPSSAFFGSINPPEATRATLVEGHGDLYADAWYDDNDALGMMFQYGYNPIVKPNEGRGRGYWRRKARKLYRHPVGRLKYKQRGRGESPFGSLADEFGDRLKTLSKNNTITRIGCRIIAYQVKIYMRNDIFMLELSVLIINY